MISSSLTRTFKKYTVIEHKHFSQTIKMELWKGKKRLELYYPLNPRQVEEKYLYWKSKYNG